MTDWHIIDSDSFLEPSPEKPPRSRWYRRWFLLIAALVVVLVAGVVTVYRQQEERRVALRQDLTDFIFEEETVRFLGRPEEASRLTDRSAPPNWQQAYQQTYETDASRSAPAAIELGKIDFDGQCAVLTVRLDGYDQVRAYCLSDQRWRRAPLPNAVWETKRSTINSVNGVQLKFLSRDQHFAAALADDLPRVFEKLQDWMNRANVTTSSQGVRLPELEIIIEPHELRAPLISDDDQRLVLNSPLLVPFAGRGRPSGQTAVRLALGQALLRRASLTSEEVSSQSLPGAARFVAAAETILAADLMLNSQAQRHLFDQWQAQLNGRWVSPFFADVLPLAESTSAPQADLAAYLTAQYILRLEGPATLATLLARLPTANSWDAMFQTILNRSTINLENEVATYSQAVEVTTAPSAQLISQFSATSSLPLQGRLLKVENQVTSDARAYVDTNDSGKPILVELSPELLFHTAEGDALPPDCTVPGARLEVDGEWLEIQRRVRARQVTVHDLSPLTIEPAPLETVAYLVEGEPPAEPDLAAEYIFPINRSFFIANTLLVPQALVALREDGTTQPLTPLDSTIRVVPLPIVPGGSVHFLFILDLPACERSWFIHYEPDAGVTGQWLGPPHPMKWVWRADQQDLMFFDSRPEAAGHNIYQSDEMSSFRPISQSATLVSFAGWNVAAEQLVFVKRAWVGATGIGLIDPSSGEIRRAKVYVHPLRARRLSPDGNWLAYLTGAKNLFDPPYRLDMLSLDKLADTTLIRLASDQGIGPPTWSPYLARPSLAVLSGSLADDELLHPTRLLTVSPDQPAAYAVIAEAEAGERIVFPVFCSDGSLLYRADRDDEYRLLRQRSGAGAELLLTRDKPFQPVACP